MTIKFSKEVSDFIRANGAMSDDYYWFPQYYKKVGEGLFEVMEFKDLPSGLKRIVEELLPQPEDNDE